MQNSKLIVQLIDVDDHKKAVPSEAPLLLSIWEQPGTIAPSPSNSVAAASDDAGRQHVGTPSPPRVKPMLWASGGLAS